MLLTQEAALQLDQTLRTHAAAVAEATRVARAALPQFYTVDQLAARYAVEGRRGAIEALLTSQQVRFLGDRTKPATWRVPLDEVLKLDQRLRGVHAL